MKQQHEINSVELSRAYYETNTQAFVESTLTADVSSIWEKFLSYIPIGGIILDWGCGSGRDTKAFIEAGYQVVATDASKELCRLASEYSGIPVRNEHFEELKDADCYDGIWACASLLHVPKDKLPAVFQIAAKALKPGGVMYVSFKYGDFEGERAGRYFTDLTEQGLNSVLKALSNMQIIESWVTRDVRETRVNEFWLNAILAKEEGGSHFA